MCVRVCVCVCVCVCALSDRSSQSRDQNVSYMFMDAQTMFIEYQQVLTSMGVHIKGQGATWEQYADSIIKSK